MCLWQSIFVESISGIISGIVVGLVVWILIKRFADRERFIQKHDRIINDLLEQHYPFYPEHIFDKVPEDSGIFIIGVPIGPHLRPIYVEETLDIRERLYLLIDRKNRNKCLATYSVSGTPAIQHFSFSYYISKSEDEREKLINRIKNEYNPICNMHPDYQFGENGD